MSRLGAPETGLSKIGILSQDFIQTEIRIAAQSMFDLNAVKLTKGGEMMVLPTYMVDLTQFVGDEDPGAMLEYITDQQTGFSITCTQEGDTTRFHVTSATGTFESQYYTNTPLSKQIAQAFRHCRYWVLILQAHDSVALLCLRRKCAQIVGTFFNDGYGVLASVTIH
jgi:hypothetical protein